jgi:hypothetical protein
MCSMKNIGVALDFLVTCYKSTIKHDEFDNIIDDQICESITNEQPI